MAIEFNDLAEIVDYIRETGVYGPDMREAIAQGIELSDSQIGDHISAVHQRFDQIQIEVDERDLFVIISKPETQSEDYQLNIVNATHSGI